MICRSTSPASGLSARRPRNSSRAVKITRTGPSGSSAAEQTLAMKRWRRSRSWSWVNSSSSWSTKISTVAWRCSARRLTSRLSRAGDSRIWRARRSTSSSVSVSAGADAASSPGASGSRVVSWPEIDRVESRSTVGRRASFRRAARVWKGRRPGRSCTTSRGPRSRSRGITPARTKELLPAPDGPMSGATGTWRRRSTKAAISGSRPKKSPRCCSSKGISPRKGLSPEGAARPGSSICSRAAATLVPEGRWSGSLSRHWSISSASPGALVCCWCTVGVGSGPLTATASFTMRCSPKGRRPVIISWSMIPSAQTSVASEGSRSSHCSGAM